MQKRSIISLNRISFQQEMNIKSLYDIFSQKPYTDDNGLGFTKIDMYSNVLEATLLKRTPTSIVDYDLVSGQFGEKEILILETFPFNIDFGNNLIYTFLSTGKLNKLKSILRDFLQNNAVYSNLEINPINLVDDLTEANFECSIREITIKKFIYDQGAYGRYVAKIIDSQVGEKLLEDYSDEIQKITVDVSSSQVDDFSLTISTNNTLSIKSEEDDFYTIVDIVKNIIK